ncbi:hypothetical protein PR048_012058 [Dryococelus australis]|uniref:Nuclease HARBI1 n=1 Tax=Dryococelus australis TaxID=614101 RepID=A0ABQ9HNE4_9NEOP|nr:hypothetical protein PR048_012058 [Dryococelus australis]
MAESIPPEERLVIALREREREREREERHTHTLCVSFFRYLASGCMFADLHYAFRIGKSTARQIVKEVCQAIWKCIAALAIPELTKERRLQIAPSFEQFANFPHCIVAVDGKHIRMIQLSNSGP